jgi:RimJ/RimL family protein N-acetyltransferase
VPKLGALDLPDEIPSIRTPRFTLRAPVSTDGDALLAIYNSPEVLSSLNRDQGIDPARWPDALVFFADMAKGGKRYSFVIDAYDVGIIGMVELHDIDPRFEQAQCTIFIDHTQRRNYYGRDSLAALIGWCFGSLRLSQVHGVLLTSNAESMALMKSAGFKDQGEGEGHTRDELPIRIRKFTISRQDWERSKAAG